MLANKLWGESSRLAYLLGAAVILLLSMLGSHELWTQEHRWAEIVSGMFFRHDFFHPYLGGNDYYDKPLLSYWLIAAVSFLSGQLSTFTLRLPSALAGIAAVWSIYRLGLHLKNKKLGLLSGWMLLTTFYFVFWARTSSADMLNLAGTLAGVAWYTEKKEQASIFNLSIFFLILALTALCKGLVGPIVTLLAILPDLIHQGRWKKYIKFSLLAAIIPAVIIYILPFWISANVGNSLYEQNGLYLVYRENILRYFQPFDHKGPIYTYFIFLPLYLFPWILFLFPAIYFMKSRWGQLSWNSKWMTWAVLLLFVFFTLSGSRRNYYILPVVPFAVLIISDWILSGEISSAKRYIWAGRTAILFFVFLFLNFAVVQPIYYHQWDLTRFASQLKNQAQIKKPWKSWQIVLLDPETKLIFYLGLPPDQKNLGINGDRRFQTSDSLRIAWPVLKHPADNMIFISRQLYAPYLKKLLPNFETISLEPAWKISFLQSKDDNAPIAFIPK